MTIHMKPTTAMAPMTTNAAWISLYSLVPLCPFVFCVLSTSGDIMAYMTTKQAMAMYKIGLIIPTVSTHVVRKLNMREKNPMATLSLRLSNPLKSAFIEFSVNWTSPVCG